MTHARWNWYATRELAGTLQRTGLRCPCCLRCTQDIEVSLDDSHFYCRKCKSEFTPAEFHAALRRPPKTGISVLYRPVGERELDGIAQAGYRRFPRQLRWRPIFLTLLTRDYAEAIARDGNSSDPDHHFVGFVTRFQVRNAFLAQYEIQTAADSSALEYWIPAEAIELFNDNIVGSIEVVSEFRRGQSVNEASPSG